MKTQSVGLSLLALLASAPLFAATRTVTLDIPGMDCPVCPITIKKALNKVDGVSQAAVNFDQRQATVTFDDAKTSVEALIKATANAGYASTLKKQ
jgi:mercuric ion binding protein